MKITGMSAQVRDPDRVNIMIDGKYKLSLTVSQAVEHNVKVGLELDEESLAVLESASQFGKLRQRALEYVLSRPHSTKEVKDYLYRKTQTTKYRSRKTGELKERAGVPPSVAEEVFAWLEDRGYVDDQKFANWWVENRNLRKGTSQRKLSAELYAKGVAQSVIEKSLSAGGRNDRDELAKVIEKKANRYDDQQKFMQYLARQGFSYDDIKEALQGD